jgi:hypothetical protein
MADSQPPDTATSDKVEITHILSQLATMLAAMLLVYLIADKAMVSLKPSTGELKAGDVVAIIGAVTTFLGTAIGLFFGVSVGQAGTKIAKDAAQTSQQNAKASANISQQAQSVAAQSLALVDTAQSATHAAVDRLQDFQSQIGRLQTNSDRLVSKVTQLHALANPVHAVRATAIFDSVATGARPSDSKIQEMVSDIVCEQIVKLGGEASPDKVDTSRKLSAAPPAGYGVDGQFYVRFCRDCTSQINSECESRVDPNNPKLIADKTDTLDTFIADAAQLAIDNPV